MAGNERAAPGSVKIGSLVSAPTIRAHGERSIQHGGNTHMADPRASWRLSISKGAPNGDPRFALLELSQRYTVSATASVPTMRYLHRNGIYKTLKAFA